jgi:hypothetical protein
MFEGYRIVCVTPAGRRRYMKLLVPLVLSSPLVDRYDIWMNTEDSGDLAFLEEVRQLAPDRVRLVAQPDGKEPGWGAIHGFARTAQDADTIYIRLDDDIVWLEPGFFETLLRFRVDHPRFFLVSPLVINNAVCSHILLTCAKINTSRFVGAVCLDQVGWREAEFAVALHRMLLDLARRGEAHRLHCGPREIALNRFSVNVICWFGRDMAAIGGEVGRSEEEELSNIIPARLGRTNCFCTDTIASHFAFYIQREIVDRAGLLDEYVALLRERKELQPLLVPTLAICDRLDAQYPTIELSLPKKQRRGPRQFLRRLLRPLLWPAPKRPQPTELSPGPAL